MKTIESKAEYFYDIYNKDELKDILDRYSIENPEVLHRYTVYIFLDYTDNIADPDYHINYNIYKMFKNDKYSEAVMTSPDNFRTNIYITTSLYSIYKNDVAYLLDFSCDPFDYHIRRETIKFNTSVSNLLIFKRLKYWMTVSVSDENEDDEICFVKPKYTDDNIWKENCMNSEIAYKNLILKGYQKSEAEYVLNLSKATEFYVSGFNYDWDDLFYDYSYKRDKTEFANILRLADAIYY